jgi:hypothetical protein
MKTTNDSPHSLQNYGEVGATLPLHSPAATHGSSLLASQYSLDFKRVLHFSVRLVYRRGFKPGLRLVEFWIVQNSCQSLALELFVSATHVQIERFKKSYS